MQQKCQLQLVGGRETLEISLYGIREQIIDLLSLHSDIDQVVELRVFGNGQDAIYRIRRYAAAMRLQSDTQTLIASQYQDGSGELPEPVLMLLHEPMRGAVSLTPRHSEGVPTGEFELPALIEKSGPWLVVPKSGSAVSFRPLFIAEVGSLSLKLMTHRACRKRC